MTVEREKNNNELFFLFSETLRLLKEWKKIERQSDDFKQLSDSECTRTWAHTKKFYWENAYAITIMHSYLQGALAKI